MARSPREVLLEEARDRHKLELARYTEAHTRIGIHLVVLAVFAAALLRYVDQPPHRDPPLVFCAFAASAVALGVTTFAVFVCVLVVLWGFGTRFPESMQTWLDHAKKVRVPYDGRDDADERAAEDLETDLMESMCEAADFNAGKNALRSRFIVYAGRGLVGAAVALVLSGAAYLYLGVGRGEPAQVQIASPLQVNLQGPVLLQPVQLQGPVELQPVQIHGPIQLQPVQLQGPISSQNPPKGDSRVRQAR